MLCGTLLRCMTSSIYSVINRCREVFYNGGRVVRFCIDVHRLIVGLAKWVVFAIAQVQDYIEKVRDLYI